MTVLDVRKTDSNRTRLGKYTAPVSGEKKPAAVTIKIIDHCRACENAVYGGDGVGDCAFSASISDVGGEILVEEAGRLRATCSVEDKVEAGESFKFITTAMNCSRCLRREGKT